MVGATQKISDEHSTINFFGLNIPRCIAIFRASLVPSQWVCHTRTREGFVRPSHIGLFDPAGDEIYSLWANPVGDGPKHLLTLVDCRTREEDAGLLSTPFTMRGLGKLLGKVLGRPAPRAPELFGNTYRDPLAAKSFNFNSIGNCACIRKTRFSVNTFKAAIADSLILGWGRRRSNSNGSPSALSTNLGPGGDMRSAFMSSR
jgi:hypothetical protein